MNWPSARDIFAFRPSVDAVSASLISDDAYTEPSDAPIRSPEPGREAADERHRRIRFDNAIRVWVAVPTFLTCLALRAGGAIDSIVPLAAALVVYALCVIAAFTFFFNIGFSRSADYVLSAMDLVTMSIAVYLTGATASPLYFVYFVPVVIHAFHRDWNLILFSGFGGVILYGVSVLLSLNSLSSAVMADLCARLVFMLLTVAIACLALSVLRKEEGRDRLRIARLRAISVLGNHLNRGCSVEEIASLSAASASLIAGALSAINSTVEILFSWSSTDAAKRIAELAVSNETRDPAATPAMTHIPIQVEGDAPYGVISVKTVKLRTLASDDLRFLEFVSLSIALCLKRHQMIGDLRDSIEMGTAAAAVYLAASRSPRAAQSTLLEGALTLMNADRAALYLWNSARERLELNSWCGIETPKQDVIVNVQRGEGLVGMAYRDGRALSGTVPGGKDSRMMAAPVQLANGNVIGVITTERGKESTEYSEDDLSIAAAFACRSAHALLGTLDAPAKELPPTAPRLAA